MRKLTVESLANMLYKKKDQARMLGIHQSTWGNSLNNPQWASTVKNMKKLEQYIRREIEHEAVASEYPEHREWCKQTLQYMKTMELFNEQ